MFAGMTLQDVFAVLDATLRVSTPLILCAMAGLFSERSGIIDISLEGKLLATAFAAAAVSAWTGGPWLALLAGMGVGILLSMVHGFACITHRGNQVVSGLAINILASGLTVVLGIAWFSQGGQTPSLSAEQRFMPINLPGTDTLVDTVPGLGLFYRDVISGHNLLVYVALVSVWVTWWVLFRTRFGLRVRAVGENPLAIDTAGLSVSGLRYSALAICGLLAGIGGTYLSVAQNAAFVREMSAGQGYIALAAMIFGKWRPVPAMLACLMFGFLQALAIRLQGFKFAIIGEIPGELVQALPYILTVVLLAGFIGKAIAPKAIGVPFVKER